MMRYESTDQKSIYRLDSVPSNALALPDNEVQLWRADLNGLAPDEPRLSQLLSSEEQTRARRFLVSQARQNFAITRGILRLLLGAYLQADPTELTFQNSGNDKPGLSGPGSASDIRFNVSHTNGVALLAFGRGREIGVDVERIRRNLDVEALARRFFSAHEQKQLTAVEAEQKFSAFFRCWTRKEAYIKAQGKGLSLPLDQFDVSLAPEDTNALLATRPDRSQAAQWSLRDVSVGSAYAAAICVEGQEWRLIA
jgi:4'-phosphopantetheinyl transferase